MASQTQGIQQLLAAEKKAAEKVGEARKRKARRIKQARDEASREINNYRQERERQFKEFEFKYLGSKEEVNAKIDTETEQQMKQMHVDVANNRSKVVDELIELVCDVHPVLHRNYNLMNLYKKL